MRIRGTTSLSLSNDPLVVIDNIRVSDRAGGIASINPEEIESIDIIKGPSASALYGTAAANGVIVVKTKRGHAGRTRWSAYTQNGVSRMPWMSHNYWKFGKNIVNGVPVTAASPIHCLVASFARSRVPSTASRIQSLSDPEAIRSRRTGSDLGSRPSANAPMRFFISADSRRRARTTCTIEQDRIKADRQSARRQVHPAISSVKIRFGATSTLPSPRAPTSTSPSVIRIAKCDRRSTEDSSRASRIRYSRRLACLQQPTNGTAKIYFGHLYSIDSRNQTQR